ncbi:SRPBCC domain-containing protein [Caulobacter sp.]|uniref:SRPBCC family protein n=1 Tax=Caulobacter sp. TaxID=78 RepID=UPI0025BAD10E|nr:SRPBCC domain-containing protein [Caulobacter sp.]MBQ1559330.1 SRPBCC domain-containing protein [Caulobacter sp.]
MTTASPSTTTRDIVLDEILPHSPSAVWSALTDGDLMGRWLMAPTGFRAVVGAHFTFQTTPAGPWDGVIHCEVLEVEPNRRLSYAWKGGHPDIAEGYGAPLDTIVSFTLTPTEAGVRLQLVHAGFAAPRNSGAYQHMGQGWRQVISRLTALIAEG